MNYRLPIILIAILISACQSGRLACPTPELVKLKRSNPNRIHVFGKRMTQDAMASSKGHIDYFRKPDMDPKDIRTIEIWDCPRPGLKHDRMVEKKKKDLQRRYEKNLKRVARESEERTKVVYTEDIINPQP